MAITQQRLRDILPTGKMLPEETWVRRHRAILTVLWMHVPALVAVGVTTGNHIGHSVSEAAIIAIFAIASGQSSLSPGVRASCATLGLVGSSAILVHFSGGLIEMHFHFFVMVAVVTLYQAWTPFLLAIAFVVLHHGTVGVIDTSQVYNHASALANPWKWALIHGFFIAGASAAGLTAWKFNERGLERERTASDELILANSELAEAQALASIGSWDYRPGLESLRCSDELYKIYGIDREDAPDAFECLLLGPIHEDDVDRVRAVIDIAATQGGSFEYEARITRPDGKTRVVQSFGNSVLGPDGHLLRMAGTAQDVTERKALEAQVQYQAFHDPLTNLANRALFLDRVEHALARQQRIPSRLAVLFMDLDDFKTVNDSMGHGAGDELLVEVAVKVRAALRPSDTFARLGGDEFAILLEDLTEEDQAEQVARRTIELLHGAVQITGAELRLQASIGIAYSDTNQTITTEQLLRHADTAMYEAKRHGKGAFQVFREGMATAAVERLALRADLQRAVDNNHFVLHYQPIVAAADGSVTGVEALVRWIHPERGMVPPLQFIPFAEESGLILPLTRWVLREACRTAGSWVGSDGRPLTVAVNISALHFRQANLREDLVEILRDTGFDPARLTLELTESVLVKDSPEVAERLIELRTLGVQLAIDDFGTGYSSLSYLRDFPIDVLKIDKAFIDSLTQGVEESALARAVIKLGRTLGKRVIAEGVENLEQVKVLRELRCEGAQGFLYSKPLEAVLLEEMLVSNRGRITVR